MSLERRFLPKILVLGFLAFSWPGATSRVLAQSPQSGSGPSAAAAVVPDVRPSLDWFQLGETEGYPGISLNSAYSDVLANRVPGKTVVVAVIDSGIDIHHEDLKDQIWINPDEISDNGLDDDGNGYTDDVFGWNFIGGADGQQVSYDTYEVTRELARLRPLYEGRSPLEIEIDEVYEYYLDVKEKYEAKKAESEEALPTVEYLLGLLPSSQKLLREFLKTDEITPESLERVPQNNPALAQARLVMSVLFENNITEEELRNYKEHLEIDLAYRLNLDFEPRTIVGDDYSNPFESVYGNPDVVGPDADHGTHVAGIIAASRSNGLGIDGIADNVRIMVLRTVPDGDERDKDVANAIRYAVDNGADIINMSFGKSFAPNYEVVEQAIRYADEKGVLIIHSAGNESENIESDPGYPRAELSDGTVAELWLEIGASSWSDGDKLAAEFSNYGQHRVDVFAPGVAMYSTYPNDTYKKEDGTSMSAPVVSGIAALLMSYFPELTAQQVRNIILESSDKSHADRFVRRPGPDGGLVKFGKLSATGGIVNAWSAVKMAASLAGSN